MESARQIAFKALRKIQNNKGFSNIVINNSLNTKALSSKDRAFVTALVYGVVERLLTLDFIIQANSAKKLKSMESDVLTILRMGVYQLFYMSSVPESAAVNESVELAKKNGLSRASGFINAVLRSCVRNFDLEKSLSEIKDENEHLSIRYSCPLWLVDMWTQQYGVEKTRLFLERSIGKPPVYIRTNTLLTDDDRLVEQLKAENITAEKDELTNCLKLDSFTDCEACKAFKNGLFHVQDKASQLCVRYADIKPNDTVIDVCSAPGGKSFTAAQYMNNQGRLLSFDLHQNRVNLIKDGAERLEIRCITADCQDATVYNESLPKADVVLCDVVCSGFGIIRRKPEIKYKTPEEISRLPEIQYRILSNSANYVKDGGTIVYSTCTVNRRENEDVVLRFLKEHKDFETVIPSEKFFSDDNNGCITLFCDDNNSDGFFICKLKKVR